MATYMSDRELRKIERDRKKEELEERATKGKKRRQKRDIREELDLLEAERVFRDAAREDTSNLRERSIADLE